MVVKPPLTTLQSLDPFVPPLICLCFVIRSRATGHQIQKGAAIHGGAAPLTRKTPKDVLQNDKKGPQSDIQEPRQGGFSKGLRGTV